MAANPYSPLRQYAVSGTMLESPAPSVELHKGQPLDLVRRLKEETGKDIWLCGGSKLAAAVLPEIDELILKISPVAIGAGIPLFEGFAGTRTATPVEHKAYSNGFVFARYALRSPSSSRAIDPAWRRGFQTTSSYAREHPLVVLDDLTAHHHSAHVGSPLFSKPVWSNG